MSNERELQLRHRRDQILHETVDLTSNIVQSLEQQHQLAYETKENLHNQNLLLSLANEKMRSMNEDLHSVMTELDSQTGCLCCKKKPKKRKTIASKVIDMKVIEPSMNVSTIPALIDNNEQEKLIVNELNQMRNQLIVFQDQVKSINRSFEQGDEILHQLGNESDQYMHAISTALNKAEQVLGRKFLVKPEQSMKSS